MAAAYLVVCASRERCAFPLEREGEEEKEEGRQATQIDVT